MSRITAASELGKDELTDPPEEDWLNQKLEHDNELGRQIVSNINQNLPFLNSQVTKLGDPLTLVHGASVTVKNPLSVPIRSVIAVACIGLSVDSTGKPTRGTYNLGLPQIEWHPSGKQDGSVVVTAIFPPPTSGSGAEGETQTISRVRSANQALTSPNAVNVTAAGSTTLTVGNWLVRGAVGFNFAGTTSVTVLQASVSKTTGAVSAADTIAVPTAGEYRHLQNMPATVLGGDFVIPIPAYLASVSVDTPLFLVAAATFSISTASCFGFLQAQRVIPYQTGVTGKVTLFFAGGE